MIDGTKIHFNKTIPCFRTRGKSPLSTTAAHSGGREVPRSPSHSLVIHWLDCYMVHVCVAVLVHAVVVVPYQRAQRGRFPCAKFLIFLLIFMNYLKSLFPFNLETYRAQRKGLRCQIESKLCLLRPHISPFRDRHRSRNTHF